MSGNMLHTTVVPVNRHPVFQLVHISQALGHCADRYISGNTRKILPTEAWYLSHVLASRTTFRAGAVYEGINLGKWRLVRPHPAQSP